jgi:hypothetical protein
MVLAGKIRSLAVRNSGRFEMLRNGGFGSHVEDRIN